MTVQLLKRLFTVAEYYQMAEAGILTEDDRVELINGEIVEMSPIGSRHAACVDRLNRLFSSHYGRAVIVRVQNPIRLSPHTEPQPDLVMLRLRPDFYAQAHPGPSDVLLLVEVSESSIAYEREVKLALYAQAGIPEVWLVNLAEMLVEVYRQPDQYAQFRPDQSLSIQAFPDIQLSLTDILGGS